MLIIKPETKKCMSELLLNSTFDTLLFIEGDITTFNQFHIDGYLQKMFFPADERDHATAQGYSTWKETRSLCFNIIKGSRTPLGFKFVFSLPRGEIDALLARDTFNFSPADVQGLYLNFKYNGETLQCITGTSFHTFIPDKSLEQLWDKAALQLFEQHGIPYEILD